MSGVGARDISEQDLGKGGVLANQQTKRGRREVVHKPKYERLRIERSTEGSIQGDKRKKKGMRYRDTVKRRV
jgi:hypothetical protein